MGASWSVDYSYSLSEPLEIESDIWEICPAVRKTDDEAVTVFIHDKEKHDSSLVEHGIKYLQTLRHPGLLKCYEVFDQSSETEIAVVTEAVVPLVEVISDLYIQEVICGIRNVIVALAFLHDKCKLSHNNLSLVSIFVGQNDACWKIAGFENMCSFSELAKEKSVNESIAHAKDVLALGKLICDVLEQIDFSPDEAALTNFQQRIQEEILEASLERRPQVKRLLNDEVFQSGYCQILDFLRNITVKTSSEKAVFFTTLHEKLHELPSHVIANRLLHLLLSRFVLIDPVAVEVFLPHLLTPSSGDNSVNKGQSMDILPILPEELYRECCIPILKKLFEVNDRHVRLILLKYFHLYVGMFEKTVLQTDILPELRLGLQDSDDELVSATFSALQYLVPFLGAHIIIGGERVQQFTERRPKFDTKGLSSTGSEIRSIKPDSQKLTTSKVNSAEGKRPQDKIQERERRREETRRRNEERRKQRQKAQMERKMAVKATVVEHTQEESGDEFDSWDNFGSQGNEDRAEVSDDSDHGRPSSSEISIDSGFSEKPRHVTEAQANPRSPPKHRENNTEDIITDKLPEGKTGFGMKLGKLKGNTKVEKEGKNLLVKDNSRNMRKENNEIEIKGKSALSTKESDFKKVLNHDSSMDSANDGVPYSNKEIFRTTRDKNDFVTNSETQTNNTKSKEKHIGSKMDVGHSSKSRNSERSKGAKSKKISQLKLVDTPWEDFDIKVTKKGHVVDDIFADMAPTLKETRKAPVKGTSMYSDKLAVVTDTEDVDGWLDDDW